MRFVLFALLALGSCADATRTAPGPEQPDVLPYRLDAPDAAPVETERDLMRRASELGDAVTETRAALA